MQWYLLNKVLGSPPQQPWSGLLLGLASGTLGLTKPQSPLRPLEVGADWCPNLPLSLLSYFRPLLSLLEPTFPPETESKSKAKVYHLGTVFPHVKLASVGLRGSVPGPAVFTAEPSPPSPTQAWKPPPPPGQPIVPLRAVWPSSKCRQSRLIGLSAARLTELTSS